MLNVSIRGTVADKKFFGCVLLAVYKRPIKELTVVSIGINYILKFSYKNKYYSLTYPQECVINNHKSMLIKLIENDIINTIGDVEIVTKM